MTIHCEISTFGVGTGNSEQFWKYGGISNIYFWENLQRWPTHIYNFQLFLILHYIWLCISDVDTITRMSHITFLQRKLLSHCLNLWSTCPAWIGPDLDHYCTCRCPSTWLNTLRPTQYGRHFQDDIFWSALSWTKMQKFRLRFHLNLFLRVQ